VKLSWPVYMIHSSNQIIAASVLKEMTQHVRFEVNFVHAGQLREVSARSAKPSLK
jgi:hypothetical protein